MCHKTAVQNAQIERFVENGMPQKIVKTVKYTLKKRAAAVAVVEAVRARENADVQRLEQISTPNRPITTTTTALRNVDGESQEIETSTPADVKKTSAPVTADLAVTFETKEMLQPMAEVEAIHLNVATSGTSPLIDAMKASELYVQTNTPKDVERHQKVTAMQPNTGEKIPKMCGRFRKLQKQQKQGGAEDHMDALAKGTQMTKRFTQRVAKAIEVMQSSNFYTFLTKTTQPAHVIVVCILAFVLLTVWPQIMDSTQSNTPLTSSSSVTTENAVHQQPNHHISQAFGSEHRKPPLAVIAYLGAFATHFGAQIWMTFVSGLSLYFSLPRHTFGQCQQILFPKYFALNASLSISMIIVYVKYLLTTWSVAACVQMMAVAVCAVVEVTVRLYLAPPMLLLMHEKYKIEGTVGSGQEVGSIVQGDLAQCPHYQRVHKSFRRIHMAIAIGNMIVLCATCLHLYHLAAKIQIS